jgi:hypothetical protein
MYIYSKIKFSLCVLIFSILFISCETDTKPPVDKPAAPVKAKYSIPKFDGQSAYDFVAKQVAFGHRLPGTETHKQTAEWLVNQFKEYGANVIEQDFTAKVYWGDELPSKISWHNSIQVLKNVFFLQRIGIVVLQEIKTLNALTSLLMAQMMVVVV